MAKRKPPRKLRAVPPRRQPPKGSLPPPVETPGRAIPLRGSPGPGGLGMKEEPSLRCRDVRGGVGALPAVWED